MTNEPNAVHLTCGFCAEAGTSDTRTVGLLGSCICVECLSRLSNRGSGGGHLPATPTATDEGDHQEPLSIQARLTLLPAVSSNAGQALRYLQEWVDETRTLGATWGEIGGALGVTRQSAWERFNGRRTTSAPKGK